MLAYVTLAIKGPAAELRLLGEPKQKKEGSLNKSIYMHTG